MTFGHLVNKWRIFKQPLQLKLTNIGCVFLCARQLHKFYINKKVARLNAALRNSNTTSEYVPSDINIAPIPGKSLMCDILVEKIAALGLSKPAYNIQCNH